MHPMLNTAIKAARRAGTIISRASLDLQHLSVARKGPKDYVTEVDRAAEEAIIEVLSEAYPDHGFIGEETGERPPLEPAGEGTPEYQWVIDPLDGTTNFLHGMPHWAVSIALEHKGKVVSAVIYDPPKDEMFYSEKGEGAWQDNSRRMRVSGRRRMNECVFATGTPFSGRGDLPTTLKDFGRILPGCAGVRQWGAASLDLAYVASGRVDGFWDRNLDEWDMAAGLLLVREAGGFAEAVDVEDKMLDSGTIIATNDGMFEPLSKLVRNT